MGKFLFAVLVCAHLVSAEPVMGQGAGTDSRTAAGCGPAETQFSVEVGAAPKTLMPPPGWEGGGVRDRGTETG